MRYSRGKQCQILLTIFLGFFPCNLKNPWYNVDIRSKRERKKDKKMEMIQITKNTSAMVRNGKVIYLVQNGKITQDPLKVRYFQRMI
jgi:hypothetical protein